MSQLNARVRWLMGLLAVSALVLLPELGGSGLWDPWEMRASSIAFDMVSPARVIVVESPSGEAGGPMTAAVRAQLGDAARVDGPDVWLTEGVAKSDKLPQRTVVTKAAAALRDRVYHGVVVDASLYARDLSDERGLEKLATELDKLQTSNDGAAVALVTGPLGADPAAVRAALDQARARTAAEEAATADPEGDADDAEPDVQAPSGDIALIAGPADAAGIDAALSGVPGVQWLRAQFKRDGVTRSVPILDSWLVAGSYRLFGFSEATSRLPFALFGLFGVLLFFWIWAPVAGDRVAAMAGMVLVTMPLWFGQARYAASDVPYAVSLLLAVGAFLRILLGGAWSVWAPALAVGALGAFFSKGLFGLAAVAAILAAYFAVTLDRRPRAVFPLVGIAALFAVCTALVFGPGEWTFWSHFRFGNRLFTAGPSDTARTFDYFVRQVGFGALPWTLFIPFGLAAMLERSVRLGADPQDAQATGTWRMLVLTLLWFGVPLAMWMIALGDLSHLDYVAAPAAALAVAWFLDAYVREDRPSHVIALTTFLILFILIRELRVYPEAGFLSLTGDPPFAKHGSDAVRFPDGFAMPREYRLFGLFGLLVAIVSFARLGTFGLAAVRAFRTGWPFWLGLQVLLVGLAVRLAVGMDALFGDAWSMAGAEALRGFDRRFVAQAIARPEQIFLAVAWAGLFMAALVTCTGVGRWFKARARRWWALPARGVAGVGRLLRLNRPIVASALLAVVGGAVLAAALARLDFGPQHSAAGTFADPLVWVLALALGAAVTVDLRGERAPAALRRAHALLGGLPRGSATLLAAAGLLSYLGLRLSKEVWQVLPEHFALLGLATVLALAVFVPVLSGRMTALFVAMTALALAWAGGALYPLLARWGQVAAIAFPDGNDHSLRYLFLTSRTTLLLAGALVALVANRMWIHCGRAVRADVPLVPDGEGRLARLVGAVERGRVMVPLFGLAALLMAGAYQQEVFPEMSYHVSQKHILDTYHASAGEDAAGDDLFKHGRIGGDDGEYNFYTRQIAEVSDRTRALEVLARTRDTAVALTGGHPGARQGVVVLPGWSAANDKDGDGRRDWPTEYGIADEVGANALTDAHKRWTPGQWKGRRLVASDGKTFQILDNTETTLQLDGTPPFSGAASVVSRYAIDDPAAADHAATAMEPARSFFVLPKAQFSELNHRFRKDNGGRHIPVLDDRSSTILLASTRLDPGQEDKNWLAKHTLTEEQLAAIPGVHPARVNFDDKLEIVGYRMGEDVVRRGSDYTLHLYIRVKAPVSINYKIFLHVDRTGTSNRIHSDHYVFNLSTDPEEKGCVGCYQTSHWLAGDIIEDVFEREVPLGTPSGQQDLWIGFYDTSTDKRLPVKDFDDKTVVHDGKNRVKIGAFSVR
jgi:4-amino-4-deoxy-L-arabinose transferase-like glycosyltransferase